MPSLRAAGLLFTFLVCTMLGIPWQASALRFNLRRRKTFPNRYHRFLCRLFGIRVTTIGKPVEGQGVLVVANHTSYFDILVMSSVARVSFVARADVVNWPLFGTLAKLQETVFVERSRRTQTGEARDQIRERLLAGDTLVLFPEGTSDDGNCVLPFKSALMGAVEAEIAKDDKGAVRYVPVQPVSISYVGLYGLPMGRENRPLFAWYGDMELVPHLWEALKAGPMDVVVEFHPPMTVDAVGGRKALATLTEQIVRRGQTRALAGLAGQEPVVVPHRTEDEEEEPELAEAAA
ncbi:MAG TPA: lysophospholipid acyltransferase family protein [Rhizomicrobium sp.]|nr:lysophospholipid acyltransferase family protein [Rhizomicrobium sp.]